MGSTQDNHVVYIGMGSNLGDCVSLLEQALCHLGELPDSRVECCSSFYRNPPLGPADQPDYVNAVCRLLTPLTPEVLLDSLQRLELACGRVRDGNRWGPRTLDLDILLIDDVLISEPKLQVPHPQLVFRSFVLVPLLEIAPDLTIPGRGRISELVKTVDATALEPVPRLSI